MHALRRRFVTNVYYHQETHFLFLHQQRQQNDLADNDSHDHNLMTFGDGKGGYYGL